MNRQLILMFPVLCFCMTTSMAALQRDNDRTPISAQARYQRTLGPFSMEGHSFEVNLRIVCRQQSKQEGRCEEDEQTVTSVRIVDENGKTRFKKAYRSPLLHQDESHLVDVTLLQGMRHRALELSYEDLSSPPPTTDKSIQLFALRNGLLEPFDSEPLEFQGGLADLPSGPSKNSRQLLENDTLRIYVRTTYFYIAIPVRVNWEEFRLEQQSSGDFDVADEPPYKVDLQIESERVVHVYAVPDQRTPSATINLGPESHIELLKARFSAGPPDKHDSAEQTWLKIRIDGREGWVLGVDDYRALGLKGLG